MILKKIELAFKKKEKEKNDATNIENVIKNPDDYSDV